MMVSVSHEDMVVATGAAHGIKQGGWLWESGNECRDIRAHLAGCASKGCASGALVFCVR